MWKLWPLWDSPAQSRLITNELLYKINIGICMYTSNSVLFKAHCLISCTYFVNLIITFLPLPLYYSLLLWVFCFVFVLPCSQGDCSSSGESREGERDSQEAIFSQYYYNGRHCHRHHREMGGSGWWVGVAGGRLLKGNVTLRVLTQMSYIHVYQLNIWIFFFPCDSR